MRRGLLAHRSQAHAHFCPLLVRCAPQQCANYDTPPLFLLSFSMAQALRSVFGERDE
jgi:hypothetical protein